MKIKSYYINLRQRWNLDPELWNEFLENLQDDYEALKEEIDDHLINENEDYLQIKINEIITKE